MKYLLPLLTCLILLGGCTAGRLSLNDRLNGPLLKTTSTPSATDVNDGRLPPGGKTTPAAVAEPIEASFNETAYLDRF